MQSRIILPLDHVPWEKAVEIMEKTRDRVWGYKVRRSVLERGLSIVGRIKAFGKVMLDFKLYDIPSAMTESLQMHLEAGADITTLHCTSGYDPRAEGLRQDGLAGVTILTSLEEETFHRFYRGESIPAMVREMAVAAASRYEYLVCSSRELNLLEGIKIKKICPGIRPAWYLQTDDQHRTAAPAEAIRGGAHLLVIGRPILTADDLVGAVDRTNREIEDALQSLHP